MPVVTVVGASGSIVPVTVNGAAAFSLAQFYASTVNGLALSDQLAAKTLISGTAPSTVPSGKIGEGVILTAGSYSFPAGYSYVTNGATGPVTIDEGLVSSSTSVLAGTGNTTLYGGAGGGLFIAGGGGNRFDGTGTGNYVIALSDGNDSVYGNAGNDLVFGGTGTNEIFTGTGNDSVFSQGKDTIVLGSGSNTVVLSGSSSTVYGGSGTALLVDVGSNNVFVGASGSTILFDGSSGSYYLSGNSTVIGGTSDTITASGNTTVFGGLNTSVFENGTGTLAFIAQSDTTATIGGGGAYAAVFGASGSDITYLTASGVNNLMAGVGNETLDGSFSTGNIAIFGNSGDDSLIGGSGADTLVAGSGNSTLTGGVGSSNMFMFSDGAAGGNVTISDFGSAAGNLVGLFGYGANEVSKALASATNVAGGSVIKLSDDTTVTFTNLTAEQLKAHGSQFLS